MVVMASPVFRSTMSKSSAFPKHDRKAWVGFGEHYIRDMIYGVNDGIRWWQARGNAISTGMGLDEAFIAARHAVSEKHAFRPCLEYYFL